MTKFNFVFQNYCLLKVLRSFQVSRSHFQWFWENKVQQSKLCPLFENKDKVTSPAKILKNGFSSIFWWNMGQISYFKNYFQVFFHEKSEFVIFFLFENASLKNRQKSDKDFVIIWDPPVKFYIGFVILVFELLLIDYQFLKLLAVLSW